MRTLIPALMLAVTLAPAVAHAQIVTGKALIKLDGYSKTDADARASLAALSASKDLDLSLEKRSVLGWIVVDLNALSEDETSAAVDILKREKHVIAVQPIGIEHELRQPNDPRLAELWGFAGIDVGTAWDTTVGNTSQRIGLIDSGINRDHIDLIPKDVGGFDFISDPSAAGDGNGRDNDYSDADVAGDFHGSHVAGTMVASADDNIGVPGINWNAGLMTARALGAEGGSQVDIGEAAIWLAGGHVDGVPDIGANKVSVINMSLGSLTTCSSFESDVYSAVVATGVTVVASAGNDGNDQPTGAPANCPGVIAVGAAGPTFELAFYSNFADDVVSVIAPGGDGSGNFDPSASVLSIDGSTNDDYIAFDGTSMASPHVAGVVSLMQAVNPRLSPRQIKSILAQSPFTCNGDCKNVAYLDAPSAVQLAGTTQGELTGNEPPPGEGGGSSSSGGCGPNSQPSADGQTCFCDPGFVVNATQTACVSSGGSGGSGDGTDDGCPVHSHDSGDGQHCTCDTGFVVNAAQTACVAAGGNDGGGVGGNAPQTCTVSLTGNDCQDGFHCEDGVCVENQDGSSRGRDESTSSSAGGCTSSGGAPTVGALAALLLLARRGRRARSPGTNEVSGASSPVNRRGTLVCTLGVVAATACSTASIDGEVDHETVPPFMTGLVYEADQLTPDDDYVAITAFYTFSSGCDLVAKQMDAKTDGLRGLLDGKDVESLIDDVRKFEEDNFPGDYWAAYAVISARGESDVADNFDIERDNAGVLVCHHHGAVDAPRDEPAAALLPDYGAPFFKDRNRDCFTSSRGEIRVSSYDRKNISLLADVTLSNESGDSAGKISLGGVAAQCDATESAVKDLLREAADVSAPANEAPPQQQAPTTPDDSCQFAFDGECDEPGTGTGACAAATDATDCGGT